MEIFKYINWLDIIVLVIVVRSVFLGAKHSLTTELFNFFGTAISLILAVQWYSKISDVLILNFSLPIWFSNMLCFVIIVEIIGLIFKYTLVALLKVLNIQLIPQLEKIGSSIIGLGRGVIVAGILVLILSFIPNGYMKESIHEKSFSGNFLINVTERTYTSLMFWIPEKEREFNIFNTPAAKTKDI